MFDFVRVRKTEIFLVVILISGAIASVTWLNAIAHGVVEENKENFNILYAMVALDFLLLILTTIIVVIRAKKRGHL